MKKHLHLLMALALAPLNNPVFEVGRDGAYKNAKDRRELPLHHWLFWTC